MKYFHNIRTLDELKKAYYRLAKQHHPDAGGDKATMQAINAEYAELFTRLQHQQTASGASRQTTTETPDEFRAIIELLLKLDGLEIELCGSWLWISGDTFAHRDELKAAGCRWASKKKMWSWHHEEDGSTYYRGKRTIEEIRVKYGSQLFKSHDSAERLGAAC